MQDFKNLVTWQKGHELVLEMYSVTQKFPEHERFGLISQLRRAASSIPANIAEGSSRGSDADFARFLQMAVGSASEVEYFLILAKDLKYLEPEAHKRLDQQINEVKRLLIAFLKKLKA
jgi:four helix bundle protein